MTPLFPELRPYLEAAFEAAPEGATHVITRYRDANQNLRTQLLRIIGRAGLEPWDRLFQNLRSSRETELAEHFPLHVVTAWLGNSPRVAQDHYLQTTEEHFRRGADSGAAGTQKAAQHTAADEGTAGAESPQVLGDRGDVPSCALVCNNGGENEYDPDGIRTGCHKS